jgi:hypothetical protein
MLYVRSAHTYIHVVCHGLQKPGYSTPHIPGITSGAASTYLHGKMTAVTAPPTACACCERTRVSVLLLLLLLGLCC